MKINSQLKPALISHWTNKAFRAFYPHIIVEPTPDAPNSYKALKPYKNAVILPVFNGDCDHTIHNTPQDNINFRAWHDCIHLQYDLSFKSEHEKAVGLIHCDQLRLIGAPTHVINAVYFDVIGQIEYYNKYNEFVGNQKQFVQVCLESGLDHALSLGKFYI